MPLLLTDWWNLYLGVSESFEFLIGDEFLRLSLDEHLQEKCLSSVWIYLNNLCVILHLTISFGWRLVDNIA